MDESANEASEDQRLAGIESTLERLESHLLDDMRSRRGWRLFWFIVAGHVFGTWLLFLVMEVWEGMALYGWFVGSIATVATWQGLSLRPFFDRWWRTCLAIFSVAASLALLSEDVDFADLFESVPPWLMTFGLAGIVAARTLRIFCGAGLAAPDGARVEVFGVTLSGLFWIATYTAGVLTVCRLAAEWYPGSFGGPMLVVPLAMYGAGVSGLFTIAMFLWPRWTSMLARALHLAGFALLALIFNVLMLNFVAVVFDSVLSGIMSWNDLLTALPYLLSFTLAQLASPICTASVLLANDHRLLFKSPATGPQEPAKTADVFA